MNWPLRCAKLEIMVSLFLGCFEGWQEWLESIIYLEQLPPLERLVMFLNHQSLIWEPHVCFKNWAFIPGRLWFIFPVISLQFPYQQTGEPGGLPSMGSYRVGHDWSDLAAKHELKTQSLSFPMTHWLSRYWKSSKSLLNLRIYDNHDF